MPSARGEVEGALPVVTLQCRPEEGGGGPGRHSRGLGQGSRAAVLRPSRVDLAEQPVSRQAGAAQGKARPSSASRGRLRRARLPRRRPGLPPGPGQPRNRKGRVWLYLTVDIHLSIGKQVLHHVVVALLGSQVQTGRALCVLQRKCHLGAEKHTGLGACQAPTEGGVGCCYTEDKGPGGGVGAGSFTDVARPGPKPTRQA